MNFYGTRTRHFIRYCSPSASTERLTHNCSTSSMVTLLTSSLGLTEKVGVAKARVPTFSGSFGQHTNVDPPKAMHVGLIWKTVFPIYCTFYKVLSKCLLELQTSESSLKGKKPVQRAKGVHIPCSFVCNTHGVSVSSSENSLDFA